MSDETGSETVTEKKIAGAVIHIKQPDPDYYFKTLELVS